MSGENENSSSKGLLLQFFIGIILVGAGLFIFSKLVIVHSSFYVWNMMGFGVSSGVTVIPLLIGIIWMFFNKKSVIAKIITVLGALFILLTIIMGVSMTLLPTPLYVYILVLGMIAAGSGLLLRALFKTN